MLNYMLDILNTAIGDFISALIFYYFLELIKHKKNRHEDEE